MGEPINVLATEYNILELILIGVVLVAIPVICSLSAYSSGWRLKRSEKRRGQKNENSDSF